MRIGIPLSKNAYTPESYAYQKYFSSLGHKVELDYQLDINNDINLYFMGFSPFWKKKKGRAKQIHEYQSLSTPPFANLKNMAKKKVNSMPDGRIFLNEHVHKNINFRDEVPYIYRDMGIDDNLFQIPSSNTQYDIVYCGSISGRIGLVNIIQNIAKYYKIVIVGYVTQDERKMLAHKNIELTGPVSREKLPEIYREARFGLNYTPNIYPFNIQTSTKTLEYLASGLGVISNRYKWSEQFFLNIGYEPIWLDKKGFLVSKVLDKKNVVSIDKMKEYSWNNILDSSNIDKFLIDCLNDLN